MNIVQLYECIKQYALTIPIVESYYNTSVYECWNNQNVKYGSVVFAVKSVRETNSIAKYDCVLYYGDRLNDNKTNRDAIQSDAVGVINSIVNQLNCSDKIEFVTYPVQSTIFEQKFADELAGAYANITIDLQSNGECCSLNPLDDYYTKYEVDELIKNVEVDLSDYYTKEQVDEKLADVSAIPYLYVIKEGNEYHYSEGSDFNGVLDALINNKPYFIYVPSALDYYSVPTDIKRVFGQINANVFAHTDGNTHYYIRYTLTSEQIYKTEQKITYASYEDLSKMGVYGLIVDYYEEYNEYVGNGVDFYTLQHAIENQNKLYTIFLPSSDNTYKIAAQQVVLDGNAIKCISVETNGNTQTTTNWTIQFDDDFFEMNISNDGSTTVDIATQDWVNNRIDGVEVDLSDYYTKTETQTNFYSKEQIDAMVGDINEILDSLINDVDTSALEARLNSILNDK